MSPLDGAVELVDITLDLYGPETDRGEESAED
jgi:hypothetical protein